MGDSSKNSRIDTEFLRKVVNKALIVTALHLHNTLVLLRKVVQDKIQEIKDKIVGELEEINTH